MSEASYSIEYAKTGRAKCKRCKEQLPKGGMRMCVVVAGTDYDLTSYHHVGCFRLPRKFVIGANKMGIEEFVQEHVTDATDAQELLPAKLDEIVQLLTEAAAAVGKKKKRSGSEEDEEPTLMARIKKAATEELEEPPKKKSKAEKKGKKEDNDDEIFDKMVAGYKEHHKTKADDLKDFLRWNNQVLKGIKDFILFKVLDGEAYGRLSMCPLDGGKLKIEEGDENHVCCQGRFDEDNQMRIPCDFKGPREDPTLRVQPWYTEEPTDEEKEAMTKIIEQAQGDGDSPETEAGTDLLAEAEQLDWKLTNKAGLQKATAELVELIAGKVDLPEGKNPKMILGPIVVANKDKTPKEILQAVLDKYGFKEEKAKKAAAKEAAVEKACANPKNAPLLLAFKEMAELYFKDNNRNAGTSYTKVVNVIKNLEFEISEDNAMSLSKGKTKVPGIGKGSAEKMKEFCETGTIQKLVEKRASVA